MKVAKLGRGVVFVLASLVATVTLGQYPRDPGIALLRVWTAPPSVPIGGAELRYAAYLAGGEYCVDARTVVMPAKPGQPWPKWSQAFSLELVDGKGKLVRPDTRVDIPETIPRDGAAQRPGAGRVVLPSLAQWCVRSAQQPIWYLRIDSKKQRVVFGRPDRSQPQ